MNQLHPADEDPVVHGYLSTLKHIQPRRGFQDRVLVNVWGPPPRWIRQARQGLAQWIESRRIWFVIAAFAAGSLIPVAVGAVVVMAWGEQAARAFGRFGPQVWSAVVTGWNAGLTTTADFLTAHMPDGGTVALISVVTLITTLICVGGLFRMIKAGGTANS